MLLDIEVAGALAPGADIVVYFAPNTDAGFLDAVSQAAHADPTPAAISISWGQSEDEWTAQARTAMDDAFADAAALGVTVTAAAGDDGSTDSATDGQAHVDFPASSPHALACGGTRCRPTRHRHGRSETVWNNGAGQRRHRRRGERRLRRCPAWQAERRGARRRRTPAGRAAACPDVAAVADPPTGYQIRVDGTGHRASAAPARSRRCGRPWSAGWPRPSAARSACCSRRCTRGAGRRVAAARLPGRHRRQQRRLPRRPGLGRLHRPRRPGRHRAAGRAQIRLTVAGSSAPS